MPQRTRFHRAGRVTRYYPAMARGGRRTSFAAPFVLVFGCGQPERPTSVTQPSTTPRDAAAPVAISDAPADAGAPPDAYEMTASEWQRLQADHERGLAACARVSHPCNPPPPPLPLRVLRGRAHALGTEDGEVVFSIRVDDAGMDLSKGWRAVLVDDAGQDVGELKVTQRGEYRGRLRAGSIPAATQVRFEVVGP